MEIDGKKIAQEIVESLNGLDTPTKSIVAISVGKNPESLSFLKQKEKTAEKLGIDFRIHEIEKDKNIPKELEKIIEDKNTGGIIIQLPLPDGSDSEKIINLIPENMDVDALNKNTNLVLAPAVEVVKEIIKRQNTVLKNSLVAVVGFGKLVGEPICNWLSGKCNELILIDEGDSIESIRNADLVISGVGKAGIIDSKLLKNEVGLIDFGYSINNGEISGDLLLNGDLSNLSFYTPTPGGTGPILVAKIFENFYKLCEE